MQFAGLHHVQLAMPRGAEAEARRFYRDFLGLIEIPKPENLAKRGGCWFRLGSHEIHLGVEDDFRPARKAHPAILVSGLEALRERLASANWTVREDEPLPGYQRFYVSDPFENRLEFLEPMP